MATATTEPPDLTMRRLVGSRAKVTFNDGAYKGQTGTVTGGFGRRANEDVGAETLCVTLPAATGGRTRTIQVPMSQVTPVQKPRRPTDPSVAAPAPAVPVVV